MSDFILTCDPLTGGPVECYGPPLEPMVRTPLIGRDKRIIREVAQAHLVTVDDIVGPRRFAPFVAARREAMQRIRNELGFSFPRIGRLFNRDHTAVLYACRGGRPTNPPSEKGDAMTDIAETELAQKLDAAYADYQCRVGRPRAMERLRHMLQRGYAAQQISDEATGANEHWKRLGEEARKLADDVLSPEQALPRAAE